MPVWSEMMERIESLKKWVNSQFSCKYTLTTASADASFRQYFRVTIHNESWIVMDAPPQQEDCGPFLKVADLFATAAVHVPVVLAQDAAQGFLLLSDLGDTTYFQALSANSDTADDLYANAVDALIKIQRISRPNALPNYDETILLSELNLFPDWYIGEYLQTRLTASNKAQLKTIFGHILKKIIAQPRVFVHRDFHSRNLMVASPNPGIIDFQDAVYGPITYDLVSLFKDAYLHWEEEKVLDWVIRYWEKARAAGLPITNDFTEFYRDFEWMGVQRHLKVLGIFARLNCRDNKTSYLKDMPLVVDYLRCACERYRELHPLLKLFDELSNTASETKVGYTF